MEPNDFFDEVMRRNGFYVRVKKIVKNDIITISIDYGGEDIEAYLLSYSEDKEVATIIYYSNKDLVDKNTNGEVFYLNALIVRLYIFYNILKNMEKRNLELSPITFVDENDNKVEGMSSLIPYPESEADISAERKLDLVTSYIVKDKNVSNDFDDELKDMGLFHSFYMLKGYVL